LRCLCFGPFSSFIFPGSLSSGMWVVTKSAVSLSFRFSWTYSSWTPWTDIKAYKTEIQRWLDDMFLTCDYTALRSWTRCECAVRERNILRNSHNRDDQLTFNTIFWKVRIPMATASKTATQPSARNISWSSLSAQVKAHKTAIR
jgi:hypothetical protein